MATASTSIPAIGRISLTVDGHEMAFSGLVGIATEMESVEHVVGTRQIDTISRLPGKQKPPTIALKRTAVRDLTLWEWHESARAGKTPEAIKDAELVVFSSDGKPVVKYRLERAWPTRVEVGSLKAGASEVLLETVTLTCDSVRRVAP